MKDGPQFLPESTEIPTPIDAKINSTNWCIKLHLLFATTLNNLHTKFLPREIQERSPDALNAWRLRLDRTVQSVHLTSTGIIEHLNYLMYPLDGFILYAVGSMEHKRRWEGELDIVYTF